MGEKKVEAPAKKAGRVAFLTKTFMMWLTALCVLGGLSVGILVQRTFLKGRFVANIGNTFKAELVFYPNDASLSALEGFLSHSKRSIIVLADTIKSQRILDLLIAKMEEGVTVRVIFGKGVALGEGSPAFYLYSKGLRELYVDELVGSSPIILMDEQYVMLGTSGLSSTSASRESGMFAIFDSPALAEQTFSYLKERLQVARRVKQ